MHNIDEELQKNFATWFREHVRHLTNLSADLRSLAFGPDQRVLVHTACNVNGARFRTLASEENLRTQNSGVMNIASFGDQEETEYYGVVKEILELRYLSTKERQRSVFLFRCDWYDLASGKKTKMRDDGYFKSVNTTALWYKNDPFILARQAKTCFYLEDTKYGAPWKVVQTFSHRHVYDVPENDEGTQQGEEINKDAYQEDLCSSARIVNVVDDEEEDVDVDDLDLNDEVQRIEKRIGAQLRRELDALNKEVQNSDDEDVEQLQGNARGDATSISDVDSDLD